MGELRDDSAGLSYTLSARTLLGRGNGCDVRLEAALVSSEHASLFWTGQAWMIRDLASRNGTFVDGHAVPARGDGDAIVLQPNQTVMFGTFLTTFASAASVHALANRIGAALR